MTERARPKPRHKKLSNKRQSVPNHLINKSKRKKDIELKRPRPSLTLKRSGHSNPTKPINLIQSVSNESNQPLFDQDEDEYKNDRNKDSSSPLINTSKKEALLQKLQKLDNITKNQSTRKARNDLDEIKQFINNNKIKNPSIQTARSFTKDDTNYKQLTNLSNKSGALPTSLKLIGIRDPKSLLYHRQFKMNNFGGIDNNNNNNHHRAQSSMMTSTTNNKYSHLRSFSSIMGPSNQNPITSTTEYVKGVKGRKPSQIFGPSSMSPNTSKPSQITTTLQQLADEYYDSGDSDNDDDDIKDDK